MTMWWVFLGGALGGGLRAGLAQLATAVGCSSRWGTLVANTTACLLLGWLVGLSRSGELSPLLAVGVGAGLAGALSTWSTLAGEVAELGRTPGWSSRHRLGAASGYLLATVALGTAATTWGALLGGG